MRAAVLIVIVLGASGCASTTAAPTDREQLAKSCADRGGRLVPIPGQHNTNDAANFACELQGDSHP
jgi:hypothetical protein